VCKHTTSTIPVGLIPVSTCKIILMPIYVVGICIPNGEQVNVGVEKSWMQNNMFTFVWVIFVTYVIWAGDDACMFYTRVDNNIKIIFCSLDSCWPSNRQFFIIIVCYFKRLDFGKIIHFKIFLKIDSIPVTLILRLMAIFNKLMKSQNCVSTQCLFDVIGLSTFPAKASMEFVLSVFAIILGQGFLGGEDEYDLVIHEWGIFRVR
jgi:hypothetical protein